MTLCARMSREKQEGMRMLRSPNALTVCGGQESMAPRTATIAAGSVLGTP